MQAWLKHNSFWKPLIWHWLTYLLSQPIKGMFLQLHIIDLCSQNYYAFKTLAHDLAIKIPCVVYIFLSFKRNFWEDYKRMSSSFLLNHQSSLISIWMRILTINVVNSSKKCFFEKLHCLQCLHQRLESKFFKILKRIWWGRSKKMFIQKKTWFFFTFLGHYAFIWWPRTKYKKVLLHFFLWHATYNLKKLKTKKE